MFGMLECDTLLSQSSAARETTVFWKGEQIRRAWGALIRKIGDVDEYDMFWWRNCVDIEWLKVENGERE